MSEPRAEFANLYDLFWDQAWRYGKGEMREALAKSLHDLTCSCADPESEEEYAWRPDPGGFNAYQRRADDLLALIREQRPTDYGPDDPPTI